MTLKPRPCGVELQRTAILIWQCLLRRRRDCSIWWITLSRHRQRMCSSATGELPRQRRLDIGGCNGELSCKTVTLDTTYHCDMIFIGRFKRNWVFWNRLVHLLRGRSSQHCCWFINNNKFTWLEYTWDEGWAYYNLSSEHSKAHLILIRNSYGTGKVIKVDYAVKLIHVKLGPPTWIYDVGLIRRYRQVMLVSMGYSYLCHFLVLCEFPNQLARGDH